MFIWLALPILAKTVQDNEYDPLSGNWPFALWTQFWSKQV
jgi:hypothetical protein